MELTENIIICNASTFPHWLTEPFYSDYVNIVVCHQGTFHFCVDGTSYTTKADETVFLSKGIMLQVTESSSDLQFTLLFYHSENIRPMLGNTVVTMRLYATIYPKACHIIHTGFENMLASYARMLQALEQQEDTSPYSAYEEKLLLLAVTYRLCSIFSMSYKVAGKDMARKIEIFESLLKLIEDNYMRERSVAFYADQLCLTPKYLSVMVKSLCGNTVQQLLFKAIIRRSIFLMKNTNMSIQQISYELNFPNASTFGTFFKKHTGLSPKHYRMATE